MLIFTNTSLFGAPGTTRTCNLKVRNLLLYPIEPQGRLIQEDFNSFYLSFQAERIIKIFNANPIESFVSFPPFLQKPVIGRFVKRKQIF